MQYFMGVVVVDRVVILLPTQPLAPVNSWRNLLSVCQQCRLKMRPCDSELSSMACILGNITVVVTAAAAAVAVVAELVVHGQVDPGDRNHAFGPSQRVSKHTLMSQKTCQRVSFKRDL